MPHHPAAGPPVAPAPECRRRPGCLLTDSLLCAQPSRLPSLDPRCHRPAGPCLRSAREPGVHGAMSKVTLALSAGCAPVFPFLLDPDWALVPHEVSSHPPVLERHFTWSARLLSDSVGLPFARCHRNGVLYHMRFVSGYFHLAERF